jgi:hypothetical protein
MITDEGRHMTRCTGSLRHRRYDERIQNPAPLRSPNASWTILESVQPRRPRRRRPLPNPKEPESRNDHHHLTFLVRVAPTLARPGVQRNLPFLWPCLACLPSLGRRSDKQPGVPDRSKKPISPRAMVLRKPARKKPKDPSTVPAGGPGSRGRSGGMAPAPPAPNYMRATTCSGARSSAAAAPHPQPGREKAVLTAAALRACRATCSSAMKGPGAAGSADACPYAYCSFKGHAHAAASVPPLGAFVAARRRLIKTQQRMKLKGASPFRKPRNAAAGHGSGYFVEIRAGSDVTSSDLSSDEVGRTEHVVFGRLGCCGGDAEGSGAASVDGSCASSDVISASSVEPSGTTKHRGLEEKKTLVDHGGEDMGDCRSDISEELDVKHGGNNPQGEVSSNVSANRIARAHVGIEQQSLMHDEPYGDFAGGVGGGAPKESSVDSVSSSLSGISFEDVSSACAYAAASSQQQNGSSIARRRRTSEQGVKRMRPFKPRLPNFLPSEKVDLKHQSVGDPRAAEEWMLDYALRKEVKKLARAQKRKVEMLVQAFESVMPTLANEKKPEQHDNGDNDKRTFTLAWPSQACS